MRQALEQGPIVASIRAGNKVFRNYAGGVIHSAECHAKKPNLDKDHAVLVVGHGYTETTKIEYFIIKNSFSTQWGDFGFARISASVSDSKDGVCGILNTLYQPNYVSN